MKNVPQEEKKYTEGEVFDIVTRTRLAWAVKCIIGIIFSSLASYYVGVSLNSPIVDTERVVSNAKRAFYGPSQIDQLYLDMTRTGLNSSTEFLEDKNDNLSIRESFGALQVEVWGKEEMSCSSYGGHMPSTAVEKEKYRQCEALGKKLREELKSRQQKLAQR